MERLAGLKIAPSEYAQWESGSRVPRVDNPKVARLYEFFGSRPEPAPEVPPMDQSAIIAAIDRQTLALSALVAELLRWRTEDRERLDQAEATLDQLVQESLDARGSQAANVPPVLDGTRE